MKDFILTETEKTQLELRHQHSKDSIESDRTKVALLYSEKWTYTQIAQALRIHGRTVARHIKDYLFGKFIKKSGGTDSMLSVVQTEALLAH